MMFTSAFADTDFVDVAEDTAVEEAAVEEAADEAVEAEEVAEDAEAEEAAADEAEEVAEAEDEDAEDVDIEAYSTNKVTELPASTTDDDGVRYEWGSVDTGKVTITATVNYSATPKSWTILTISAKNDTSDVGDSNVKIKTADAEGALTVNGAAADIGNLVAGDNTFVIVCDTDANTATVSLNGGAEFTLENAGVSNGVSGVKVNNKSGNVATINAVDVQKGDASAETTTETSTSAATTEAATEATTVAPTSGFTGGGVCPVAQLPATVTGNDDSNTNVILGTADNKQPVSGKVTATVKFTLDTVAGKGTVLVLNTLAEDTGSIADAGQLGIRAIDNDGNCVFSKGSDSATACGSIVAGENTAVFTLDTATGEATCTLNGGATVSATDTTGVSNILGVKFNKKDGRNCTITSFTAVSGDSSSSVETTTEATTTTTTVAATTTTTVETTTEVTTEADLTGKLVYKTVSDKSNYTLEDLTLHVDFKLDQSYVDSTFKGLNNTTFYITYNPDVVRAKSATAGDVKGAKDVDPDDGESPFETFIPKKTVNNQIALTPSATNADYAGMGADGTKTAAELGKIKISAAFMYSQTPAVVVTEGETLFGIDFDIVGEGDANIQLIGVNGGDIAAMGRATDVDESGNQIKYATAFVGQTITVGEDVVTSTTEATTEETTTTTTETTTKKSDSSNDDTTTETTTEAVVSNGYDFVVSETNKDGFDTGAVVFDGSKATVEATLPLKYNTTTKPDVVTTPNGDNSYPCNLQSNTSTSTTLKINGEDAKCRVVLKITAKQDTTIKIDNKIGSDKTNYILKGDVTEGGTPEVLVEKTNGESSSIYETFTVDLKAGDVVYFAGKGTNPVFYAIDGLVGDSNNGSDNTTTVTTTTEATTETTTEVKLEEGQVGLKAVESEDRTYIKNGTTNTVTVNYVLKNNTLNGVNSYTFFINYDPTVLKATGVTNVNGDVAVKKTIEKALKVVPAAGNTDYPTADGTKTAAELGRIKVAYVASIENASKVDAVTGESTVMFSVTYDVLKGADAADTNTYDSQIGVELVGTGFQSSPAAMAAGKVTSGVALDSALVFGPEKADTTTTTTVASPDDDKTTTVDTTTEATTTTVADKTTEATTAATADKTTEATTTTVSADATTETTTVRRSSGGGGGGSSSRKSTTTTTEATTEATTDADTEVTSKTYVDVDGNAFGLNIPTEYVRGDNNFVDLGNYDWAAEAINNLYKLGIINGTSDEYYSPALGCKRGDFAIIINNMLGLSLEPTKNFDDNADPSKYYYNACRVGYTAGILSGYGDNNYKPEKYCSREEMFVLVAKTLEFLGEDVTSTDLSVNDKYNDVDSISWWSAPYCAYLTDMGIIGGTAAGNAEPKRDINRAEMAVMMYKDYQFIVNKYGKAIEQAAEDATADDESEDATAEGAETVEESTEETTAAVTYGRGKTKIRVNSDATTTTDSSDEEEVEE
jgi:hypothetical protein